LDQSQGLGQVWGDAGETFSSYNASFGKARQRPFQLPPTPSTVLEKPPSRRTPSTVLEKPPSHPPSARLDIIFKLGGDPITRLCLVAS